MIDGSIALLHLTHPPPELIDKGRARIKEIEALHLWVFGLFLTMFPSYVTFLS